jgi:hypothetical protein
VQCTLRLTLEWPEYDGESRTASRGSSWTPVENVMSPEQPLALLPEHGLQSVTETIGETPSRVDGEGPHPPNGAATAGGGPGWAMSGPLQGHENAIQKRRRLRRQLPGSTSRSDPDARKPESKSPKEGERKQEPPKRALPNNASVPGLTQASIA